MRPSAVHGNGLAVVYSIPGCGVKCSLVTFAPFLVISHFGNVDPDPKTEALYRGADQPTRLLSLKERRGGESISPGQQGADQLF